MPVNRSSWEHSLPITLALMAPFDLLASMAMDIYIPAVPLMPVELGSSPSSIQLSLTFYLLGLGIGQLLFGPLADRWGRRSVLLGGAVLFSLASMLIAMADTIQWLLIGRVLQSLGASATLVATFATVRDVYAARPEGTVIYGMLSSMLAAVPALAPLVGALILEHLGWRAIFWALSGASLVPLVHAFFRWHETVPPRVAAMAAPWPILRSARFWRYTCAFGAAMGTFFVFFSISPRILIDGAGYTSLEFSLSFASAAAVMVLTARLARPFVNRWGIDGCIRRGMILILSGAVLLAVCTIADQGFATVILPFWMMSIGIVLTTSVTAQGALEEFSDCAGLAVAIYFSGQSVIVAVLGTAAVLVLDGNTVWPLVVFGAVAACCVLWALHVSSRSSPK